MKYLAFPLALIALPGAAQAQATDSTASGQPAIDHSAMDHSAMDHAAPVEPAEHQGHAEPSHTSPAIATEGSGTSLLPAAEGRMRGHHLQAGDWMVMTHGFGALQYTDHSGPRGDDKAYATTMAMLMGERQTSWGRVQLRSMLSLEPLMDPRGYPNLFATGETAGGEPLVDRQHPHDLFMELAARVDFNLGPDMRLFVYGGPVAEPALGPSAFMHRASAELNPEPPITHHWFDSTHITYGVATLGLAGAGWQFEGSTFRGAEPDEHRWDIETPKFDSWSVRGTLVPSRQFVVQASYGQISEPEALHPGQDEFRFTASGHFDNGHGLAAMLAFSNKNRSPGGSLAAWLAEASWDLDHANTLFSRFENVLNDEYFPDHDDPLHEQKFRVGKFQLGYARRVPVGPFELALGGSLAAFDAPAAIAPSYGANPWGYTLFGRVTLVR